MNFFSSRVNVKGTAPSGILPLRICGRSLESGLVRRSILMLMSGRRLAPISPHFTDVFSSNNSLVDISPVAAMPIMTTVIPMLSFDTFHLNDLCAKIYSQPAATILSNINVDCSPCETELVRTKAAFAFVPAMNFAAFTNHAEQKSALCKTLQP